MHKHPHHRTATNESDAPSRARLATVRRRSRTTIIGLLAAVAIVAAGFAPAVGVDAPSGGDADRTDVALAHSVWGATWS